MKCACLPRWAGTQLRNGTTFFLSGHDMSFHPRAGADEN